MSEIRNYPSVKDFKQLADADSEVRFVSKDNEMSGTGKIGAFFSGRNARMAAMSDFISAVSREYGDEVGYLAANLLAAPKMQGRALTGAMVRDVLAACASEQSRIAEYNLRAAGQNAPESVNQVLEEIAGQHDLNAEQKDTVRTFLEHNLDKAVRSLKNPLTANNLQSALREAVQKDLTDLLALVGKGNLSDKSYLSGIKDELKDLPPLVGLELGKLVCSGDRSFLAVTYAKAHLNDILNAAGPDGQITREALWKGLSGSDEIPADLSLDSMSDCDFCNALINKVISPKLLDSAELSSLPEERKHQAMVAIERALYRGLKFDVAVSCIKGQHTITLADFSQPLSVSVEHLSKDIRQAESSLVCDLARRGGLVSGSVNNRQFESTINFEHKNESVSINLSDPQKYILSPQDLDNYKSLRPSSVSLQCCAQALQLCEGNELQAARLVAALGQQSMILARYVSPIVNVLTPNQVTAEHSPASVVVKRLDNGDIEVSMHTLNPDKTYYSINYLVKPDGSTPVTSLKISPVALHNQTVAESQNRSSEA